MKFQKPNFGCIAVWMVMLLVSSVALAAESAKKINVLFIAVDDLRTELGCYGHEQILSPNIDRLAKRGMVFERAYCQQAICMASRASLLSGYRPDKGEIYRCGPLFKHVPDALTLNQVFLNNGYETVALGKIYHHESDYSKGWSTEHYEAKGEWEGRGYLSKESKQIVREYDKSKKSTEKRDGMGPAYEHPDVADNAYADGMLAEHAIQELNRLKNQPFFLAVGFHRPHLPFNVPNKYWNMYSAEKIKLADHPFAPKDATKFSDYQWGELRGYYGMPAKGPMPDDLARELIHAYDACVTYTDAMIGKVLDELDRLKLSENTVVVLWGDHGWKLGDHGMWAKHTNFEVDTRVPLILSAPQMKAAGSKTMAFTEFVDVYPTLVELCGIELPKHLEGTSMVPLLNDPQRPWKKAAFSQYPYKDKGMGYSMRTDRYRYTEWHEIEGGKVLGCELYDHQLDPSENVNVADKPENKQLIADLSKELAAGYQAAKPKP